MKQKINILECTIRDGSYAIDYNFTLKDVALIGKSLEDAGFRLIEIGHGVGLGGSPKYGKSIASDEEYCEIAKHVFKKAKWGMFFIPGIGTKEHLDMAAKHGMGFVRIGTNIEEIQKAEEYIKYAKKLGMLVTSNLMKSYAVSPEKFAECAKLADNYGVDVLYLVDSAGGMFPEEVREYLEAVKGKLSCELGFHGHNNLGMGVANTLEAVKCGCKYVDSSLQGLGRSSGNAETEILALALERKGYDTGIDALRTLSIGSKLVKPMLENKGGLDEIGVVSGYAQFHSSFMKVLEENTAKYGVDPRKLIIELTKITKIDAPPALVESIAKRLKDEDDNNKKSEKPESKKGSSGTDGASALSSDTLKKLFQERSKDFRKVSFDIAGEVNAIAKKENKISIFTISFTHLDKEELHFPFVRKNIHSVVGNAEVNSEEQVFDIIKEVDGLVDYVFLDVSEVKLSSDVVKKARELAHKSRILIYDDIDIWIDSICTFMLLSQKTRDDKVLIIGVNDDSKKVMLRLASLSIDLTIWDEDDSKAKKTEQLISELYHDSRNPVKIRSEKNLADAVSGQDFIIGMTGQKSYLTKEAIKNIGSSTIIIDGAIGSIGEPAVEAFNEKGNEVYRFDVRASLSGKILTMIEAYDLIKNIAGKKKMDGFNIVAGGVIGRKGDIIVDSINNPKAVLGVADGKGFMIKDSSLLDKYSSNMKKAQEWMMKQNLRIAGDHI
jgi:4-hydroxy-2-oxovalerate aldolase